MVISYGIDLNMSLIDLSSLVTRMKALSSNCYDFKKLPVLAHTISFFYNYKNVFSTVLKAVRNVKVILISWFTHPVLKRYILT